MSKVIVITDNGEQREYNEFILFGFKDGDIERSIVCSDAHACFANKSLEAYVNKLFAQNELKAKDND